MREHDYRLVGIIETQGTSLSECQSVRGELCNNEKGRNSDQEEGSSIYQMKYF
jgi:hypothetical protein